MSYLSGRLQEGRNEVEVILKVPTEIREWR